MAAAEAIALLRVEGLGKRFGGLTALADIDFELRGRGIFGLIGPNGSGKTTLFNTITGVHRATAGRISYRGNDITGWPDHRVARAGIARTFQNLRLFRRLTVADNVLGAQTSLDDVRAWELVLPGARERRRKVRAEALLEMVGLADRRGDLAGELSLGAQRRLELARALARAPEVLLLDEPTGGMTPRETEAMSALIAGIAEDGPAVLLIEHKMGMVMRLSHRVTVLNFGRKIAEGPPAEIQSDPVVQEAYLGAGAQDA